MQVIMENWEVFLGVALAISEALSLFPGMKSNGILQMVANMLKQISGNK